MAYEGYFLSPIFGPKIFVSVHHLWVVARRWIFFGSDFRTPNFSFQSTIYGLLPTMDIVWVRFSDPKLIFLSVHHLWVGALCTDMINKPLVSFSSLISGNGATAFADDQVIWVIQVN